jgi:alkylation response protein AidB-like acyl-CoA dehydrogenase
VSDYVPPLDDIRFVLTHLCQLEDLAKLEPFTHADPDTVLGVLEECGRFMADVVAPLNHPADKQGLSLSDGVVTTPDGFKEAYARYVEAGWGAVPFDPEYGGGGFPWVVGVAAQELLTSASMSFSMGPLLTQGAIDLLSHHASDEQKARYLPKLLTGEWAATMNLSEPQAGSDVGALTTRAVKADDGTYRITGQKIFITFGEHDLSENIVHLVLARTPDAPPGTKGISCFIVPKFLVEEDGSRGERNDVLCVAIEHKMGIHASPTCTMVYGDRGEGAVGYLIGEENSGMRAMFTMMNNARLSVGLQGLALAERSYQQAVAFAQERRQGQIVGGTPGEQVPIIEHPDVRRMLMTMRALIEAMRGLMYVNGTAIDLAAHHPDQAVRQAHQEMADLLTPLSKGWGTEMGLEATSIGIQVHGGMGYIEETGSAQHFRDARIPPIYEGTNGIQAMDLVGRKLPMRGGGVVVDHLDRMAAVAAELEGSGDEDLVAIAQRLAEGVTAARDATAWLIEHGAFDPNQALAGATPYLRLLATVSGAWVLARAAAAARRPGADEPEDFREAKVVTARFFAENLLPPALGLVSAVKSGVEPLFAIPADRL